MEHIDHDHLSTQVEGSNSNSIYSIQFNSIKFISTFIHHYMSIIIIIHCIFKNEKSKWICRKLNKLIRDIPGITHNQFT